MCRNGLKSRVDLCSQPWAIVALITNAYQYWSMQAAGNHVWCILGRWWLQHLSVFFGEIDLDMLYSCSIVFSSISWPSRRRRHISKSIHHPTGDILAILNVHHSWVELFLENHPTRDIFCPIDHCWREMFFSAPKPPTFTHHNILIITPNIIILKAPPGALSGIKCQDNCFFAHLISVQGSTQLPATMWPPNLFLIFFIVLKKVLCQVVGFFLGRYLVHMAPGNEEGARTLCKF